MLEAIILYGRNTLICDLPHDPLELQNKLNSIGISLTADHIPLSDEDGSEIRVKLFLKQRKDIDRKTWRLGRAACRNLQQFGCPTWYESPNGPRLTRISSSASPTPTARMKPKL